MSERNPFKKKKVQNNNKQMGLALSKLMDKLFDKREARVLMLGLDAAGKTTILFKLKLGEVVQSIPTIGFNVETVEFKKTKFNVWDVGGQDKIRPMWKHYYQNAEALIFVVDSSDRNRVDKARMELHRMLDEEDLKDVILLVFANKQDIAVMDIKEIIEKLDLGSIKGRPWHCQGTSALTGQGLIEGLTWLDKKLAQVKK